MDKLDQLVLAVDTLDALGDVKAIARRVMPQWGENITCETLKGGSGNVVYKCRCSDQDDRRAILVRVYGQFSPKLFRPNPRSALWLMRFLAYRGCCGKVLCQFTNGVVYEYTTGQQLTFDGAKDPITKSLIAKEMAKVNSHVPGSVLVADVTAHPICEAGLFGRLDHYISQLPDDLNQLNTKVRPIIQSKKELISEIDFVKENINLGCTDKVLAHGDLWTGNIIYDQKQKNVRFIDFESAGWYFRSFDLAYFLCTEFDSNCTIMCYPEKEQLEFIREYLFELSRIRETKTPISEREVQNVFEECKWLGLGILLNRVLLGYTLNDDGVEEFDFVWFGNEHVKEYFRRKALYSPQ